jgi:hypothetical protein
MSALKQPNSKRNLDAAISRLGQDVDDVRRIRLIVANTVVGQMLPDGAAKGGSALKIRYGSTSTRFTRDFDATRSVDLEHFVSAFRGNLTIGWNGFTGTIIKRDPAKPKGIPKYYVMQPYDIKMQYNGKSWLTVPLEIGHNEIDDASAPDYEIADDIVNLFRTLGFSDPQPIPLMPLTYQIAQKLHGVTEEDSERAHDLVDLQVIVKNSDIDYAKTKEICVRLFNYRRRQPWPPKVKKYDNWEDLYATQAAGLDVISNVDEAIVWANTLINRVNNS